MHMPNIYGSDRVVTVIVQDKTIKNRSDWIL